MKQEVIRWYWNKAPTDRSPYSTGNSDNHCGPATGRRGIAHRLRNCRLGKFGRLSTPRKGRVWVLANSDDQDSYWFITLGDV